MLVKYKIDAVHATLKRVIESGLTPDEMTELYKHLQKAGYEDKDIDLEKNEIYQAGDTIEITKESFDLLHNSCKLKQTIIYMFGDTPELPIKGKLKRKRIDNESGQLVIEWQKTNDHLKETNTHFLSSYFDFEQPEFKKIPIIEADDSLLDVHNLIIKYLMINNEWSEEKSEEYLQPIQHAMKKAEAVFYQP